MAAPPPDLPAVRHVPGTGTRPERAFLARYRATVPSLVTETNALQVAAYRYGFDLYAAGFYWEAHEVWEPVWMACRPTGRPRALLAGLIQLANAALKRDMAQPQAAARLHMAARQHLADAAVGGSGLMGVSIDDLIRAIDTGEADIRLPPLPASDGRDGL
jgi:hypothetical protein